MLKIIVIILILHLCQFYILIYYSIAILSLVFI